MKGIGTDIIELDRIRRSYERYGADLVDYLLSPREKDLLPGGPTRVQFLAGRFAAKEATYKAIGSSLDKGVRWTDLEILKSHNGAPKIQLSGRALELAQQSKISDLHISISHCKDYAVAFVTAL